MKLQFASDNIPVNGVGRSNHYPKITFLCLFILLHLASYDSVDQTTNSNFLTDLYSPSSATCTDAANQSNVMSARSLIVDPLCIKNKCPPNSFCYLGKCPCHPGYNGSTCSQRMSTANPWFTEQCPNLKPGAITYQFHTPVHNLGGEYTSSNSSDSMIKINADTIKEKCGVQLAACAYLCYSNPNYGTAVVPHSLWREAQTLETSLWQQVGTIIDSAANDRAAEHWKAFHDYLTLKEKQLLSLGDVIEVGAGPWTQLKAILHIRPELIVNSYTIWEPGAEKYIKNVLSCSYKDGKSLLKWNHQGDTMNSRHSFPVTVISLPGEVSLPDNSNNRSTSMKPSSAAIDGAGSFVPGKRFDTLISINVLEHVQDAFKYLSRLYLSLKVSGILILHERYYSDLGVVNGDRYHPVRVKKAVLDHFLTGFEILFNNCSANYDGRAGEVGYYLIARKLPLARRSV